MREQTREIAEELAARHPDRLTTEWRKNKREGRILIDTARNTYAQTTVAPYAVRAKPGAPVATPLRWEELEDRQLRADQPHARVDAGAPGVATATPGRRSGGGKIGGVLWRRRARTDRSPDGADLGVRVLSVARDDEPGPPTLRGGVAASCTRSSPRR